MFSYDNVLPHYVTVEQAVKSRKGAYEHPISKEATARLSKSEYDSMTPEHRKYLHPGAVPYGAGHSMKIHGEGKPYGEK